MVAFSRYVELAYEIAKSRPWYNRRMRGPGTQSVHRRFVSQLADAYNENNHQQATVSQARSFLEENIGPP